MARTELSELEGCVLGVVSRLGPCSAYRVRKEFGQSLTTSWRGSAGAIYPLLERLLTKRLVSQAKVSGDARGTRKLSLTPRGHKALTNWVEETTTWLGEPSADPIRSRLQFLSETGVDPVAAIEQWIELTEASMAKITATQNGKLAPTDPYDAAALNGSLIQLEARKKWLGELRETLAAAE